MAITVLLYQNKYIGKNCLIRFKTPGSGCSKYWIKLYTGQLLIQWTAIQWKKMVAKKHGQRLSGYPMFVQWTTFYPVDKHQDSLLKKERGELIQTIQYLLCSFIKCRLKTKQYQTD